MRVAFITARPPYPLNTGGRIRSFHLLQQVSRAHEVTLITARESEEERTALESLRDVLPAVAINAVTVPSRRAPVRRLMQAARGLFGELPYTWASYNSGRLQHHLQDVLQTGRFDVVHCDHIQVAHCLGDGNIPRVLNAHNLESVLIRRAAAYEVSRFRKTLMSGQAVKTLKAEIHAHRCFDRSIMVSELDGAQLQTLLPDQPISVVPNGVDPLWLEPVQETAASPVIVFVGSMDWLPNVDAVNFFLERVFPRVREAVPEVEFMVVGRSPRDSLARDWAARGARVTGTVDDVRRFVAKASVVVVPLRIGGGTRLKILEAWAMRRAVLSTSVGAEGLPAVHGNNIALADTPEEMTSCAVMLLRDAHMAVKLGAAGRRLVEERFTWSKVSNRLLEAYEETVALSARRGARPAGTRSKPRFGVPVRA